MNFEKLEFKITLCPKVLLSQNKYPEFKILIDNHVYHHSKDLGVNSTDEQIDIIFNANLDKGDHEFALQFLNKNSQKDTVARDGKIIDDLFIEIRKIEVDGIDINSLLPKLAKYTLDEPVVFNNISSQEFLNHKFLSWNGSYKFTFNSPFYVWLLDQF